MTNTILNDKRFHNLLHNGGLDVWARGTSLGITTTGDTGSGSANITTIADSVVTNVRTGMTVTGATVGTSKTVSTLTSNTAIAMNSGSGATTATTEPIAFGLPDGAYSADRWYVLTETSGIRVSRTTGNSAEYAALLSQNAIATNQRFGFAQVIESQDAYESRGDYVSFQLQFKTSTVTPVRAAILEWSGTADSVTKDVVNSWTNATFTAGNFFTSTTTTVTAVSDAVSATAADTWTSLTVAGTISSSCNNIIVFVWTEDPQTPTSTMTVTEAGLYESPVAVNWIPRPVAQEASICKRFFERFDSTGNAPYGVGYATTTANARIFMPFFAKRSAPTVTVGGLIADYVVYTAAGTVTPTSSSSGATNKNATWFNMVAATGFTLGQGVHLSDANNATTPYIEATAEL